MSGPLDIGIPRIGHLQARAVLDSAPPGLVDKVVNWWPLDEAATGPFVDSHGSDDLTIAGIGSGEASVPGIVGTAIDPGDDALISADEFVCEATTAFSVCAWFEGAASASPLFRNLIGKVEHSSTGDWQIALVGNDQHQFMFRVSSQLTGWGGAGNNQVVTANPAKASGWDMVAGVFDHAGEGKIKVYHNADAVVEIATNAAPRSNGGDKFHIGRFLGESTPHASRPTDEVAYFNAALTAEEVAWLFNSAAGRSHSEL